MMTNTTDRLLTNAAAAGDNAAFAALVRRYESLMIGVIRRYVTDTNSTNDVLQETLIQAWGGISQLRDTDAAGSWFAQIARNRARDYLRSSQRREQPTESAKLEQIINRYGRDYDTFERAVEALNTLDNAPEAHRHAAQLFYIHGFAIDDIAERQDRSPGTVKRYLHDARNHMRRELGVSTPKGKEYTMGRHRAGIMSQPFPKRRPNIAVATLDEKPFSVDAREVRWWFIEPEVGRRAMWAFYDPPDENTDYWHLTGAYDAVVTRPARIHDLDCVEIISDHWEPKTGWKPSVNLNYERLTDESIETVAVGFESAGKLQLITYMDDLEKKWGRTTEPRVLIDAERFSRTSEGGYEFSQGEQGEIGVGLFCVTIGDLTETCLRVFDEYPEPEERGILMESFLTREGRTMLCRRYNGIRWQEEHRGRWDQRFPENQCVTINGVIYVHWYDCVPGWPLGIEP